MSKGFSFISFIQFLLFLLFTIFAILGLPIPEVRAHYGSSDRIVIFSNEIPPGAPEFQNRFLR